MCVDYFLAKDEWPQPIPSGYARPLPSEGPPFDPWVVPTELVGVYRSVTDPLDDLSYVANSDFIPDDDAQE